MRKNSDKNNGTLNHKTSHTEVWIKLTELSAQLQFCNDKIIELCLKIEEKNKLSKEEIRNIYKNIGKDMERINSRVSKLENVKFAGNVVISFITIIFMCLGYLLGLWGSIKELVS